MSSSSVLSDGKAPIPLVTINGKYVAIAHTVCAYLAFFVALIVGCYLHYHKIVENEHYGYPNEWFPSVSATIGDRYPERNVFQILIALTATPRFLLLFLVYLRLHKPNSKLSLYGLIVGVLRTFTCGGWVYVTSTDDHDFHDIAMISYIVLTIPWYIINVKLTDKDSSLRFYRTVSGISFFAMLVPLIYLFIQHKVHKLAGAYSYYAYCEWSLIILDVFFDSWNILDLESLQITFSQGDKSMKVQFYKTVSLNHAINPIAKDIEIATNLDKSISRIDKYSKLTAFEYKIYNYPAMIVQIVNSFVFWTNLTGLLAMIWYFPLWNMGISGFEATIGSVSVFPVFLIIPFIRNKMAEYPQVTRSLAVLFGIGAYLWNTPEYRLVSCSIGTGFSVISTANEFWYINLINESTKQSKDTINPDYILSKLVTQSFGTLFSIGLLLSSIIKFACFTNNPVWPIMHPENGGWNNTGIMLGCIAAFFTPNYAHFYQSLNMNTQASSTVKVATKRESLFLSALSFGAMIFLMHALLTDSSTIISWVWNGHPIHGPIAVPHGAISLSVFAIGIFQGFITERSTLVSFKYYALCVLGFILLVNFHGWMGYIGGLVFTFYLASICPVFFENVSRFNPGLSFTLGFLVHIILMLASVWIVAYAFVPGGPLLRERTDIVYGIPVFLLAFGIYNAQQYEIGVNDDFDEKTSGNKNAENEVSMSVIFNKMVLIQNKFRKMLMILTVLSAIIAFLRFPFEDPKPFNPETKSFTAGIWTVHFALDNDLWASEDRMRDLMSDLEVDIMGMLETDTQRIVMGNRDMTQKIAHDLGYYTDYGPGPNKHTWGCLLFSKFPIINSTHHLLPSPVGELAPAIHATLDIYGEYVDIIVFHSGQEEDDEDRRLQSLYLSELMGSTTNPTILLSYLVTEPLTGNYNTYVSEKSQMHDIDPTDDDRWCEYILFKKIHRLGYARVSRGTITDTEVQVGKFLLANNQEREDESLLYTNKRIAEGDVPESLRFPKMFYGDGVRGHRYHVFDEPRYFS